MSKKAIQPNTSDQLIAELVFQVNPKEILSKDGLLAQLKKKIVEKVMQSELEHELGYGKHGKTTKNTENRRNGSYSKTVIDGDGKKLEIEVQRDRVQVRPSSNVAAKAAIKFLDSLVSLAFVVQIKPFIKYHILFKFL
jgi:hypothetical protein